MESIQIKSNQINNKAFITAIAKKVIDGLTDNQLKAILEKRALSEKKDIVPEGDDEIVEPNIEDLQELLFVTEQFGDDEDFGNIKMTGSDLL